MYVSSLNCLGVKAEDLNIQTQADVLTLSAQATSDPAILCDQVLEETTIMLQKETEAGATEEFEGRLPYPIESSDVQTSG